MINCINEVDISSMKNLRICPVIIIVNEVIYIYKYIYKYIFNIYMNKNIELQKLVLSRNIINTDKYITEY